jgi:hypothetical protein
MSIVVPPWFIQRYPVEDIEWLLHSEFGLEFYQQFLIHKGISMFITGVPESGKTQLDLWVLKWLKELETIVKWDTGKDDILPLFNFGKPIQFLIPYGCHFEIKGPLPCEVVITPVLAPELYLDYIRRDWINILCIRNFFIDEIEMKKYVRDIFRGFLRRARLNEFEGWSPATIDLDEAHAVMGSDRFGKDDISQKTGVELGMDLKESRKKGFRFILISQGYYDLPPLSRENTPCYGVKRGTMCDKHDNTTINYLSGFARECEARHGWIILPNGKYYGRRNPLAFPFFPDPPGIRIIYRGFYDQISKGDTEEELLNDGGWRAASYIQHDQEVRAPSIAEIPNFGE